MKLVFDQVRQVAKWNTTVLVRGESGTGKGAGRRRHPLQFAPCPQAPSSSSTARRCPTTCWSPSFSGTRKGAFTGASTQRKGRFEQADGGTLFLDEIGEISPAFQAKLLRVLQEGEFERVGGTRTLKVDVRIIAATNRDLEAEVKGRLSARTSTIASTSCPSSCLL